MEKSFICGLSTKFLVVLSIFYISPYLNSQTLYWEKILENNPNYLLLKDSIGNIYHSDRTGFYKSSDNGDNWTLIFYEPQKTLNEVAIDGSGVFWGIFNELPGVYKSTNSGSNWILIGLNDYEFKIIKISPDYKIWVVADSILFNSSDNGISWNLFEHNDYPRTLSFHENKALLVSYVDSWPNSGSVLLSLDYGNTWTDIWPLSHFWHGTFDNEGNIYLSSGYFPFWGGIRKSTDNGITWEHICEYANQSVWFDEQNRFYRASSNYFYRSTDQGSNWRLLGMLPNMKNVLFKDSLIFVGCIYQSNFAGIWRTGLNKPYIGKDYFPTQVGNRWQYFWIDYLTQENYFRVQYIEKDTIINGKKYYELKGFTEATVRYDDSLNILFRRYNDSDIICMDFNLNYLSTFQRIPLWGTLNSIVVGEINKVFGFNFENSIYHTKTVKYEYALSTNYEIFCENFGQVYFGVYASRDGHLIRAIINDEDSVRYYSDGEKPIINFQPILITDSLNVDFLLQVDHAYTFNQNGILYNFIDSVLIHSYYSNGDTVIINTPVLLQNQSNTINYSLELTLDSLLITNEFDYYYKIYAEDKGVVEESSYSPDSGYYQLVYDTTSTNIIKDEINPLEFILYQNYPNPFNPSTTINYQIPKKGFVTLKVYDILGDEIATLVNEEKPAGIFEVELNASDLPSGIYFYRLKANTFIETKKMVLIK